MTLAVPALILDNTGSICRRLDSKLNSFTEFQSHMYKEYQYLEIKLLNSKTLRRFRRNKTANKINK